MTVARAGSVGADRSHKIRTVVETLSQERCASPRRSCSSENPLELTSRGAPMGPLLGSGAFHLQYSVHENMRIC